MKVRTAALDAALRHAYYEHLWTHAEKRARFDHYLHEHGYVAEDSDALWAEFDQQAGSALVEDIRRTHESDLREHWAESYQGFTLTPADQ